MSLAGVMAHLQASLPGLAVAQPGMIDLPARKQQDALEFYNLLKPLFAKPDGETVTLYPLTAKGSDGIRPTPDGVYGVVRSEQRIWQGKAVATVTAFSLEIRATSYQALVAQEDAVRALLAATPGVETVNALDDYDEEVKLYVSVLEVELSAAVADVLLMEGAIKAVNTPACINVYPIREQDYAVLLAASDLEALHIHRALLRDAMTGWQEQGGNGPLLFTEGQPLPIDCGLFAWLDVYRQRQNPQ